MSSDLQRAFNAALGQMGQSEDAAGPLRLSDAMSGFASMTQTILPNQFEDSVWNEILSDNQNNSMKLQFGRALRRWDSLKSAEWIQNTKNNTDERRKLILQRLDVPSGVSDSINHQFPVARIKQAIVISESHEEWYTAERQDLHKFYWTGYENYLESISGWPGESIESLNAATTKIVERLSDPERMELYQVKGLVVGYVQSGKTANFTAVVAKAADAGYRLIIVLAGTLNVLRAQTQRRLDRDLVGREILEADRCKDYVEDNDWPDKFASYGDLPSVLGHFDWRRLTDFKYDYQHLKHGIASLEFEKKYSGRRFNDPENLHCAPARLIVIKKHPSVIKKVAADLKRLKAALEEVPTLIIDDESDQASVNTRKPTTAEVRERTATNEQIIGLLDTLPRAQYIGYTATPFANVFVDPDDSKDLFPKDFIVGLQRPKGYMGVRDFFDFAKDGEELTDEEIPDGYKSNERAYVRDLVGDDAEPQNLRKAVLSFILSGALKLFREAHGAEVSTRHHTMLVHKSVKQKDHEDDANQVEMVYQSLRIGSRTFYRDVEKEWADDFQPVSKTRAPGTKAPRDFEELVPFVDKCINRINRNGKPVRIVNGDKKYEDLLPDFEAGSIWGILVGGTKLSRGYTVEGLTVSYYRRKINQADTLMQVGRWFGFRRGYQDLVRLFVGRQEPDKKGQSFDLYLAFKAICQDEERFREQLTRYSEGEGSDRVLPRQIPPLVPSHLLPPTSANKMYNASVRFQNFGGRGSEKGSTPDKVADRRSNSRAVDHFLRSGQFVGSRNLKTRFSEEDAFTDLPAKVWHSSKEALLELMRSYKWQDNKKLFEREIDFISGTGKQDPEIDHVLVMARQRKVLTGNFTWQCADETMTVWTRKRIQRRRFNALSGSRERQVADYLAHVKCDVEEAVPEVEELRQRQQVVVLIYPLVPTENEFRPGANLGDGDVSVAFGLRFPYNSIPQKIVFGVQDEAQEDEVIIDAGR